MPYSVSISQGVRYHLLGKICPRQVHRFYIGDARSQLTTKQISDLKKFTAWLCSNWSNRLRRVSKPCPMPCNPTHGTDTHSKTLIHVRKRLSARMALGLEWIAQEWISRRTCPWMAEAAEAFGLNEIATALREAIPLQKQMLNWRGSGRHRRTGLSGLGSQDRRIERPDSGGWRRGIFSQGGRGVANRRVRTHAHRAAASVRPSNVVPDLIRDLSPTSTNEAPDQVRGTDIFVRHDPWLERWRGNRKRFPAGHRGTSMS